MTTFPDKEYLHILIEHESIAVKEDFSEIEQLLALSGAKLNWIADFISDENIEWKKETISLDSLYLTGVNPEWNHYIKILANGSPKVMNELMQTDTTLRSMSEKLPASDFPILVRIENDKKKVLDGMNRTLRALYDGKDTVEAYVGYQISKPKPHCEAHVVYDILRAYQRGLNTSKQDCVAALRFLKNSYVNVEELLRTRFSAEWIDNKDLQEIILEALK